MRVTTNVHVHQKRALAWPLGALVRGGWMGGGEAIPRELSGNVGQQPCCLQAIVCVRGPSALLPSEDVLG